MKGNWFSLQEIKPIDSLSIEAKAAVCDNSLFFSGHFPRQPILPGIALLSMAEGALRPTLRESNRFVAGLRRIRFRTVIHSGGLFTVILTPQEEKPESEYVFTIQHQNKKICDGVILIAEKQPPIAPLHPPPSAAPLDYFIEDFIPHRKHIRLVESLLYVDEQRCDTKSVVAEDWPLIEDGQVSPLVLIEVVAQTGSAQMGWIRRKMEKSGGRGLLVGIKSAKWNINRLKLHSCLLASVKPVMKHENYLVFNARVDSDSGCCAEIQFQAFRPE